MHSSAPFSQLLTRKRVYSRAVRARPERRHCFHHGTDVRRPIADGGLHRLAQLIIARGGWQVLLEERRFRAFLVREITPFTRLEHLYGFASSLDGLAQYVQYLFVNWFAAKLYLLVLDVSENSPQNQRRGLVARLARDVEIGLETRQKVGYRFCGIDHLAHVKEARKKLVIAQ